MFLSRSLKIKMSMNLNWIFKQNLSHQLNESALYLWGEVEGKEFDTQKVAELLSEQYGIDMDIAERDAQRWIDRLEECGLIE